MPRCRQCRVRLRFRYGGYCHRCGAPTEIGELSATSERLVRISAGMALFVMLAALVQVIA